MTWQNDRTSEGLIDLFQTIPEDDYCGGVGTTCLIGFPVHKGVLSAEWAAYEQATKDDDYQMNTTHSLGKRYNTDIGKLNDIFCCVADYDWLNQDLENAIQFAELLIIDGCSLEEALRFTEEWAER